VFDSGATTMGLSSTNRIEMPKLHAKHSVCVNQDYPEVELVDMIMYGKGGGICKENHTQG
jgi:hypothetical protein